MKFTLLFSALIISCCIGCKKNDPVKVQLMTYPLPGDQFFPEGIAYNSKTGIFYTGSTANGDIVQVNVETGITSLFSGGAKQGRSFCTGMKLDAKGRLWVCGGPTNIIQVLDAGGNLIKSWDIKARFNSGFINDCIISGGYIYFTDSQVKKIYRAYVAEASPGEPQEWLSFTDQQIPYVAGTNANGIEVTPDGKYLIIVISNSGKLYKINIANKNIAEISLNAPVPSGDGLLLDENTLYVSRNATGLIFPVALTDNYGQGTVGNGFGENLLFNTTLAKAGKYILVVNAQLNKRGTVAGPILPFTVSRVTIP
jgi:hypothetical protein